MTRLRLGLARVGAFLGSIIFWTWWAFRAASDWVGRSAVGEEFGHLVNERLPRWADWLFSTPWWVPAILATILTGFLIWLSWPRTERLIMSAQVPAAPEPSVAAPPTGGGDIASFVGYVSELPPFEVARIYIGQVFVSTEKLADERILNISMRGFNGSGHTIFFHSAEGSMKVCESDVPTPWVKTMRKIGPYQEFQVDLEQKLAGDLASQIFDLQAGAAIPIDFRPLRLMAGSQQEPGDLRPVPLWEGITIRRGDNLQVSRSYVATIGPISLRVV